MRSDGREIGLLLHALRLARRAQRVTSTAVPVVADELCRSRWLPRNVDEAAAHNAAVRASSWLARRSRSLDTCLVRSLVTGALLSDRPDVKVYVGLAAVDGGAVNGPSVEGHAWVAVNGEAVPGPEASALDGRTLSEVVAIPLRRLVP